MSMTLKVPIYKVECSKALLLALLKFVQLLYKLFRN